ncbi:MAG: DegT/DnrJ/EryC1/StrS family aminotransferase [Bacillota bacterium]|nr:DegT/DnrJ/EryC1/StrS family aminotransferase [Bacillota bacterium]
MARIFLSSPHMGGREMGFVKEAFDTNWIAPLGKNVNEFEREMASYIGIGHAAALSAGTAALHMGLKAAGVKQGDIVFCSALTFSASANPIMYEKATPIFIDSEYETWNMSPKALRKAFNKYPNVKAVVVVDLYGQSADWDEILDICGEHNVQVIEDAAEALGSTYKGKKCGSFGKYGILSFNGNKIITTSGGGMLLSDDEERIQKVRFWSTQSREKARHYQHEELGYNYRMSNIVAGIGRGQMFVLDDRVAKKREIFEKYKKAFEDIDDIEMMPRFEKGESNCWLSCMTIKQNSKVSPLDIMIALENSDIESRPIWKPMNLQPYYKKYDFITESTQISVAEDIFNRGVCLPSDTKITEEDQQRVIDIIKKLF